MMFKIVWLQIATSSSLTF